MRHFFSTAIIGVVAFAQSPNLRPEFSDTSVKPNKGDCCLTYGVGNGSGGGRFGPLKILIGLACQVEQFQISGGPRWIESDRFDVVGKAEGAHADFNQLKAMLRSLLEDRFKLKVHLESKESSVYAMTVAKGGPRMSLSADQTSPDVNGPTRQGAGPNRGVIRVGVGNLVGNASTMSRLANVLSQRLDRLVVDNTNLTGRFDVRLQWAPSPGENVFDPNGARLATEIIDMRGRSLPLDPAGPSIFSAIQEQLGLRLESSRDLVDMLVIDHAEQPSEN